MEYKKENSIICNVTNNTLRQPLICADRQQAALNVAAPMMAQSFLGSDWQLQAIYKDEQIYVQNTDGKTFLLQDKFVSDFGVRSLWNYLKQLCFDPDRLSNTLKNQGYHVRIVGSQAFLTRGLWGGSDKETKAEIDTMIRRNAYRQMQKKLPSLNADLVTYAWQSLFTHKAKMPMVSVVLEHCLIKTEADKKELPHLLATLSVQDRQRSINQIITALLYEAKRYNWADPHCRLRRDLLSLIDFEKKFSSYDKERFSSYIQKQEEEEADFFGVNLTDDSDTEDEKLLQTAKKEDARTVKKRLESAQSTAVVAGLNAFKHLKTKIKNKEESIKKEPKTKPRKKTTKPKDKKLSDLKASDIVGDKADAQRSKIKESWDKKVVADLKKLNDGFDLAVKENNLEAFLKSIETQFVVMQVRGVSYSITHWSARQRRMHRSADEKQKPLYSAAVYTLTNTKMQEDWIDHPEALNIAATELKKRLIALRQTKSVKSPKGKTYLSAADYLQEVYTNTYDSFGALAEEFLGVKSNPFISTSDRPYHALRYAFGVKYYDGYKDYRLRPRWQKDGRAERSKSGKVYLSIHPVSDYDAQGPSSVPKMLWDKRIFVNNQIVAERESSFYAYLPARRVIDHFVAKYPSFIGYKEIYLEKYGMDEDLYESFRDLILHNPPHSEKHKLAKLMLGEWLCMFHEVRLIQSAQEYCRKNNFVLVYRQINGTFNFTLPPDTPYRPNVDKATREKTQQERLQRESSPATHASPDQLAKQLEKLKISPKRESKAKRSLAAALDKADSSTDSLESAMHRLYLDDHPAGTICPTRGRGDCALHACFGTLQNGEYTLTQDRVDAMRAEIRTFLSQWPSLANIPETPLQEGSDQTLRDLITLAMQDEYEHESLETHPLMQSQNDYAGYLKSITTKGRYLWINEIYLIALISRTRIVYWGDNAQARDTFNPNINVLAGYVSAFDWQSPGTVNIYAQDSGHYERFIPKTQKPLKLMSLKQSRFKQEILETLKLSGFLGFSLLITTFIVTSSFYILNWEGKWIQLCVLLLIQTIIAIPIILWQARLFALKHKHVFYNLYEDGRKASLKDIRAIEVFALYSNAIFILLFALNTTLLIAFGSLMQNPFNMLLCLCGGTILSWGILFIVHHLHNCKILNHNKKNSIDQDIQEIAFLLKDVDQKKERQDEIFLLGRTMRQKKKYFSYYQ